MGAHRVRGVPFSVSEYDTPAPNDAAAPLGVKDGASTLDVSQAERSLWYLLER